MQRITEERGGSMADFILSAVVFAVAISGLFWIGYRFGYRRGFRAGLRYPEK